MSASEDMADQRPEGDGGWLVYSKRGAPPMRYLLD